MKILAALVTLLCLPSYVAAGEDASITQENNSNKDEVEQEGSRRLGYTQAPRLPTVEKWVSRRAAFATLYNLLEIVELAPGGPLATSPSVTLFAPNEAAFAYTFDKYPGLDGVLLDDYDALTTVLSYHALVGKALSGDIPVGTTKKKMLNGEWLRIIKTCSDVYKGDHDEECTIQLRDGTNDLATVTIADNLARNGVIHVINKVLIPPSLAATVEGLIPVHGGGHYDNYYGY